VHVKCIAQLCVEPIEMTFWLCARMGPRNHVLDGDPDPPWEGAILGKGAPIVKYRDTAVTCAKTDEPIVMPFGLSARSVVRSHEVDGAQSPPRERAILGKWSPIVKYRDFLP